MLRMCRGDVHATYVLCMCGVCAINVLWICDGSAENLPRVRHCSAAGVHAMGMLWVRRGYATGTQRACDGFCVGRASRGACD